LIRIGELGRRTGVSADALRAWERRYGLLEPTARGGFRLYSEEDERRVRAMRALIEEGCRRPRPRWLAPRPLRRGVRASSRGSRQPASSMRSASSTRGHPTRTSTSCWPRWPSTRSPPGCCCRRITYLGADTPLPSVAAVAAEVGADLVVVALDAALLERSRDPLRELAGARWLLLAGDGVEADPAAWLGARKLARTPPSRRRGRRGGL